MKYISVLFLSLLLASCALVENTKGSSEKQIQHLTILANQGNTQAQASLIRIYENRTDAHSRAEAVKWYTELAMKGDTSAQILLADMYLSGDGTPKNYPEAVRWFTEAANSNHKNSAIAQLQLAKIYNNGIGVRQDYNKAFKLLSSAAKQYNSDAQVLLASAYLQGHGVKTNMMMAKNWFGIACDNQNLIGCKGYKLLNTSGI